MDKLTEYRQLIQALLTEYTTLVNQARTEDLETHTVFDEQHDRYMVYKTGWWRNKRIGNVRKPRNSSAASCADSFAPR